MSTPNLSRLLVEAACKREGVREALPGYWFDWLACPICGENGLALTYDPFDDGPCCPQCKTYWLTVDTVKRTTPILVPPDLTLESELHNALRLADAVAASHGREPVSCFPLWTEFRCMIDVPANIGASGQTRTAAVIAALCAALQVEQP